MQAPRQANTPSAQTETQPLQSPTDKSESPLYFFTKTTDIINSENLYLHKEELRYGYENRSRKLIRKNITKGKSL